MPDPELPVDFRSTPPPVSGTEGLEGLRESLRATHGMLPGIDDMPEVPQLSVDEHVDLNVLHDAVHDKLEGQATDTRAVPRSNQPPREPGEGRDDYETRIRFKSK